MTIHGMTEAALVEVLQGHLSPSQEIKSPDRLIGREAYLRRIGRALHSPGRHIFIFGDRGVGKTSLAVTAGQIAATENKNFIYIPCSQDTSFYDVIWSIGSVVQRADLSVKRSGGFTFGINLPGYGGLNLGHSSASDAFPRPTSFSECLEVLRFVRSQMVGQIVIAIDELDRITDPSEKSHFAELLKNVGSVLEDIRFVYCGIGADVDELIGSHLSVGRMFEPVEVEKLSQDSLWRIIEDTSSILGVTIPRGMLLRIGVISDGFPHYVHLIGECLFYSMHDDSEAVSECAKRHFDAALRAALEKAEPSLKKVYQMATEKSKNQLDYEEALWALADRASTRRQIKEIYETSYVQISKARVGRSTLSKETFNMRLLALRKESHAKIIQGHGSGWFSFRENVVRGYVRMKAESKGVLLASDPIR